MQKIIVADPEKCYGCLTCVVECVYAKTGVARNVPLTDPIFSQTCLEVMPIRQADRIYAVPVVCRHCEDAPCLSVCPASAIRRTSQEASVLLDRELCIGCKACILACPFGMIRLSDDEKVVHKCDLCIARLERGQEPACVWSCPTGALQFKPLDEIAEEASKRAAQETLAAFESGSKVTS